VKKFIVNSSLLIVHCLILLTITSYLLAINTYAQTCGSGTNKATGLVSAPDILNSFNTSGGCIKDPKAAFTPFSIPTYADLKSLYYNQSKATKSTTLSSISNSTAFTGSTVYWINGDLTVSGTPTGSGTQVIFVEGKLIFNSNYTYSPAQGGTVFIVNGNVTILQSVTIVDAIIISGGTICTAFDGAFCLNGTTLTPQLTVNGSLVSLNESFPIKFRRNLADNTQPAEKINHQTKYLVLLKELFSQTIQKWSEITGDVVLSTPGPTPAPTLIPNPSPTPTPSPSPTPTPTPTPTPSPTPSPTPAPTPTPTPTPTPSTTDIQTFISSGTWSKPASGGTDTTIQCWGGGGGGAGGYYGGQGGGGAGGYSTATVATSSLASTLTVTVGAGGAGGTNAPTHGANGGGSSVTGTGVSAGGGIGGIFSSPVGGANGSIGRPAGVGVVAGTNATTGTAGTMGSGAAGGGIGGGGGGGGQSSQDSGPGGTGGNGGGTSNSGGGGGGGAGYGYSTSNNNYNGGNGGNGGVGSIGTGGNGGGINFGDYNGSNATGFASGGGGASGIGGYGGNGSGGKCIITTTPPPPCTPTTWYQDSDNDTYGNPAITQSSCTQPVGYIANNTDCYDGNANAKPGQTLYFITQRGDGSFDYNCSGSTTTDLANSRSSAGCMNDCISDPVGGNCMAVWALPPAYVYLGTTPTGSSCGQSGYAVMNSCTVSTCNATCQSQGNNSMSTTSTTHTVACN